MDTACRAHTDPANTIARFANLCDFGDLDDYATILAEDVEISIVQGPEPGRVVSQTHGRDEALASAVLRRSERALGPRSGRMHLLAPSAILTDDGDHVECVTHWSLIVQHVSGPSTQSAGYYRDTLQRTPAGWTLAARTTVLLSPIAD